MANKQSVNWLPQQRVDVPDLKAVDSSVIHDFATLLKCFQDNNPYILRGFTIPFTSVKSSLQMVVADSIVWAPNQSSGSFLKVDPAAANEFLNTANTKVVGALADGALNFVSIRFKREADSSTSDNVTLFDEDSQQEYTVTAPRGLVLDYEIVISQTDFGSNASVAIIEINTSGQVTRIKNCKAGLFRLGSGGANPDINNEATLTPNPENPLEATSGIDPDPFAGGDWEIENFKQWMDMVMTLFKKVFGSAQWYNTSAVSGVNLLDLYNDAVGSLITSRGKFQQGGAGALTWTDDINIRSIISHRTYKIPANSINLADKQVAYIQLQRNIDFQPANTFTFNSIANTVTGTIPVTGISPGDWIKAVSHGESAWRKVKTVAGNTIALYGPLDTYPDNLPNYPTNISGVKAIKCVGTYTMQIADPQNVPDDSDVYWIAKRDDNTFATISISDVERNTSIATIKTIGNHGLVPGQMVRVSNVTVDTDFNVDAEILDTPTADTFTYINTGNDVPLTPDTGDVDFIAIIYLRGIGELSEGESLAIDNEVPANILAYIGASIDSQDSPIYGDVSSGSLDLPNYNAVAGENLTSRLSKATAMLADVQQNYNTEIDAGDVTWESNQVSISNAQLSIPGTSIGAAPVSINNIVNQALADNECLYVDINRTTGTALTLSSPTLLSALTPAQHRLVVVRRIGANLIVRG